MNTEMKPVDVLAVMDGERRMLVKLRSLAEWSECASVEKGDAILRDHDNACAAVAELIEAAAEFREGTKCHIRECAHCEGRSRRIDAALARIGGAA